MSSPAAMTGTPPELDAICGHLLRRAHQVHNALWAEEVGTAPTSTQYALLIALRARPGVDQRTAGELAALDRSSTMDVVARLARRGWLQRSRDPLDGRRDVLNLTDPALRALAGMEEQVARVQDGLLAPLPQRSRPAFLRRLAAVAHVDRSVTGDAPQRIPGHLVRRAQQVHTALFAELCTDLGTDAGADGDANAGADGGLTGPQYAVMLTLGEQGLGQLAVAERAGIDTSTMGDLADRLLRRGWIDARRDPDDGRRRILTLTAAGRTAVANANPRVAEVQRRLLAPVPSAQRARFLASLRIVARA